MVNIDILLRGNIFDAINEEPYGGIVAMCGNRIVAVEKGFEKLQEWTEKGARCIDCKDRLIMPGFIDSHMHFFDGAFQNSKFMCRDLFQCKSARECVEVMVQFAKRNPDYEIITGMGWFVPLWTDSEHPTKEMIDEFISDRPVYLMCADGHSFWLNSQALQECNIKAEQDLLFGSIELDEKGEPNGILHELDACAYSAMKSQKLPASESQKLIVDFIHDLSKHGITSTTDMSISPKPFPITEEMLVIEELEKNKLLDIRLNLYPSLGITEDFAFAKEYDRRFCSDLFRVAGLKAFVDGVHGNNTALLLEPYIDQPDHLGSSYFPYELYKQQIAAANREGFGVKLHCVGEGATHLALDAYESSSKENMNKSYRNSIEHMETIRAEDIKRLARLNVTASMQPSHLMYGGDTIREKLGPERAKMEYVLKTLVNAGVNISFGTDYPVAPYDPMINIYFSMTRCDVKGNPVGNEPEERLSLAEALKAYTTGSAYCLNMEKKIGTLEKDKLADVIVFDRNLFEIEPKELLDAQIVLTISDGKVVYEK